MVALTLIVMEQFQERKSGWTLRAVRNMLININKHNSLRAGCDMPLPRVVVTKKAVVNVQCKEDTFFCVVGCRQSVSGYYTRGQHCVVSGLFDGAPYGWFETSDAPVAEV